MITLDSETGYLPCGLHRMPIRDFEKLFGWNEWRRFLLMGLSKAFHQLEAAGCRQLIVDGSFVSAKEAPHDWDAAYDTQGMRMEALDPVLRRYEDGRRAMNAKYFGDLFPWDESSGEAGPYLEFFRTDREGVPKGVVLFDLGGGS